MRLCDRDIERYLAEGRIRIEPHPLPGKINGVSVDLHLGHRFRVFNDHAAPYIDLSGPREEVDQAINRIMSKEIRIAEDGAFFIHPGELALAATAETITVPDDLVGWLDGRSSLARLGLMVHVTAHRIDPGWSGAIVLECYNSGKLPLALRPSAPTTSAWMPSTAARLGQRRAGLAMMSRSIPGTEPRAAWRPCRAAPQCLRIN